MSDASCDQLSLADVSTVGSGRTFRLILSIESDLPSSMNQLTISLSVKHDVFLKRDSFIDTTTELSAGLSL
jgi:hypothetical protein